MYRLNGPFDLVGLGVLPGSLDLNATLNPLRNDVVAVLREELHSK